MLWKLLYINQSFKMRCSEIPFLSIHSLHKLYEQIFDFFYPVYPKPCTVFGANSFQPLNQTELLLILDR